MPRAGVRDCLGGVDLQLTLQVTGEVGDTEKYLIATSEQPICAYHKGEWLQEKVGDALLTHMQS